MLSLKMVQVRLLVHGSYNFEISPNSIISDSARYEAIRAASSETFDEFISVIAIKGQKRDSKY